MWLFCLFVAIPIIEIAFFIQIGGWLGLFPTLLIVIITAALGAILVRSQAIATFGNIKNGFLTVHNPDKTLAEGAMILFAGALLLTPGFFTDAIGFLLLTPWFRAQIFKFFKNKVGFQRTATGTNSYTRHRRYSRNPNESVIIEGEYKEEDNRKSRRKDE